MPVRNQNWYDLQEGRRYPLDDRGTGVSDSGDLIRDNIIVDCHIKFPAEYGTHAYIAGLTVTGAIVSAIIAAAEDLAGANSRVIGAVSIPKPIAVAQNYSITPVAPGVAGWMAFGSGCAENFSGKYSSPGQTLILTRNARAYRQMPVASLGKYGLPDTLADVVRVTADPPVFAEYKKITVQEKNVNAIVFSLRGQFEDTEEQPLREFLGPCGGRPESGTCPKDPILTINGIKPDCAGNINLEVGDGLSTYLFEDCGGVGINFEIGLSEFCPKEEINPDCSRTDGPPIAGKDLCEFSSSSSAGEVQNSSTNLTSSSAPALPSYYSSSIAAVDCLYLPHCANLFSENADDVTVRFGIFSHENIANPPGCVNSSSSSGVIDFAGIPGATSSSSSSSTSSATEEVIYRTVLQSAGVTGLNVLTLKNCATDWAINQRIAATFKLGGGARRNGGVVVNYLTPAQTGQNATFLAALLDITQNEFKLIRYNGTNIVTEFTENFSDSSFIYNPDTWYTAAITPTVLPNNNISLRCTLNEFDSLVPAMSFEVATADYGMVTGAAGVISNQAYTYFSHITIGV